jgi:hypothetical protein
MKIPRQCPLVILVRWVGKEVRHSAVKKAEMKGEAGKKLSGVPLHSITTPSSDIKSWEGSIW